MEKCNCVASTTPSKIKVIDLHHRVGCHVELQKTLLQTLTQKTASQSHCVQMFLGNRQGYSTRKLNPKDLQESTAYCDKMGKTFYVHCPLIANLSKNPESKDEKELEILNKSWKAVSSEVKQLNGMPGSCVLHCGSKGSVDNLIRNLNDFKVPRNRHISQKKLLCLENSAAQGSSIGRNYDEMRKIYEGVDSNTIGLCIDTQHIFGAGVNSLQTHEDIVKLFDEVESIYGKPDVIHLNDSKKTFNSHVDRHECLTSGYIWNSEDEGLKSLLDICYDKDLDCILETPNASADLDLVRNQYIDLQTIDVYKN